MPHTSTFALPLCLTLIIFVIAEHIYKHTIACWGSRLWGTYTLCAIQQRLLRIQPARWAGHRRIVTRRRARKARVSIIDGDDGTGAGTGADDGPIKLSHGEPLASPCSTIWILRSMVLGAGDSRARPSSSQRTAATVDVQDDDDDEEPPGVAPEPNDEMVQVHVYYGHEVRYQYRVQAGAAWRRVAELLAHDLRIEADTVTLTHLWGASIDKQQEVTAPPSGGVRMIGYRIMQIPPTHRRDAAAEGDGRRHRSRSRDRASFSSDDSGRPVRRLVMHWQQGTTMQRLTVSEEEIGKPAEEVTPSDVESWLRQAHPHLIPERTRIGLMQGDSPSYGTAMRHNTPIPASLWQWRSQLFITTSQQVGANAPFQDVDYSAALQICLGAVGDRMLKSQIKLLLKGDPALGRRVMKISGAKSNVADLMVAAARRYRMQIKDEPGTKTVSSHAGKPPAAVQRSESTWQPAEQRRPKKTHVAGEAVKSVKEQDSSGPLELFSEDWSHEPMTSLQLAQDGVYLTQNKEEAQVLARKLQHAKHAVALISISELPQTTHSEQVVFRARQQMTQAGKVIQRERILRGYLSNFGPVWVRAKMKVATVTRPITGIASSTVLLLSTRKEVVSDSMWRKVQQYSTPKEVRAGLQEIPHLPTNVIDIFNVQKSSEAFAVRLRVLRSDLQQWMLSEVPFAVQPLDEADSYKILWDASVTSLAEARSKYSQVEGFSGLALNQKGIGIRFTPTTIAAARRGVGMVAGDVYTVTGIPCTMLETEVQSMLDQIGWKAQLITQSRRVRSRVTSYRVRAEQAPGQSAIRVCTGDEVVTIQVAPLSRPERPSPNMSQVEPTTWAQVAKRTLGKEEVKSVKGGSDPVSAPLHSMKINMPGASAMPTESATDDEDESMPYDIWEEEQDMVDTIALADLPYTETSERKTRPQPPKKRKAVQASKTSAFVPKSSSSAKLRVQKMEADVDDLKQAMQSLMQQLAQAFPTQSQQQPRQGVYRTSIPFPECQQTEQAKTASVAGDGACLWHSLAAHLQGFSPDQVLGPEKGHELKKTLLTLFSEHEVTCAQVLGVSPTSVTGILAEWRPEQAWADARLVALASAHYNVSIAIMNRRDACIEIVSPTPQHLSTAPVVVP